MRPELRMMWIKRLRWQHSELKTQWQRLIRSGTIWEMWKRRECEPWSPGKHLRRCWTPSKLVWVMLQGPIMGRMGRTVMLIEELDMLSGDDKPGWVICTISKTVLHLMERFQPKQIKFTELVQLGWGDAADCFFERDQKYGTIEWKVLAVVQPQAKENAAASGLTTCVEIMETLDIVPGNLQMPEVTSPPGSSPMTLASRKPQ